MLCEMPRRDAVQFAFIGVDAAFLRDVGAHDAVNGVLIGRGDMERADIAAALDKSEHGSLVCRAAFAG